MPGADAELADLDLVLAAGRPVVAVAHRVRSPAGGRAWLADRRGALRAALHRYGHLLVRGLPMTSAADFAALRDALFAELAPYQEDSTPRSDLGHGVFSSTDLPARHPIRLHNENSYVLRFPGLLLFGCVVASAHGGATTVGDGRELLARLDPGLVRRFRSRGWTLVRNYHPGLGLPWSKVFGTSSRDELDRYLAGNLIAWRWHPDGGLTTSQRRPAVLSHPDTGDQVWFNHVAFWNRHTMEAGMRAALLASYGEGRLPYDTSYGDGAPIAAEDVRGLNAAYDAVRRSEPYRAGDLLVVDNLLSCHGREPYTGDRRVLVALGEPRTIAQCAPEVAPAPGPLPG